MLGFFSRQGQNNIWYVRMYQVQASDGLCTRPYTHFGDAILSYMSRVSRAVSQVSPLGQCLWSMVKCAGFNK